MYTVFCWMLSVYPSFDPYMWIYATFLSLPPPKKGQGSWKYSKIACATFIQWDLNSPREVWWCIYVFLVFSLNFNVVHLVCLMFTSVNFVENLLCLLRIDLHSDFLIILSFSHIGEFEFWVYGSFFIAFCDACFLRGCQGGFAFEFLFFRHLITILDLN